jgi:hypothetical protein
MQPEIQNCTNVSLLLELQLIEYLMSTHYFTSYLVRQKVHGSNFVSDFVSLNV